MKLTILIALLLFFSQFGLPKFTITSSAKAQEPFDRYHTFKPWKDEIFDLDNFAIFLRKNPETIGYIAFYVGDKDSCSQVKARIDKSKKYLIEHRKIDKRRIVVIYAGRLTNFSTTILQPIIKDLPPPYSDSSNRNPKGIAKCK